MGVLKRTLTWVVVFVFGFILISTGWSTSKITESTEEYTVVDKAQDSESFIKTIYPHYPFLIVPVTPETTITITGPVVTLIGLAILFILYALTRRSSFKLPNGNLARHINLRNLKTLYVVGLLGGIYTAWYFRGDISSNWEKYSKLERHTVILVWFSVALIATAVWVGWKNGWKYVSRIVVPLAILQGTVFVLFPSLWQTWEKHWEIAWMFNAMVLGFFIFPISGIPGARLIAFIILAISLFGGAWKYTETSAGREFLASLESEEKENLQTTGRIYWLPTPAMEGKDLRSFPPNRFVNFIQDGDTASLTMLSREWKKRASWIWDNSLGSGTWQDLIPDREKDLNSGTLTVTPTGDPKVFRGIWHSNEVPSRPWPFRMVIGG